MKVILSGGGTAGHIYPALAVGEELRSRGAEVLFVGASGRMEMERIPSAGFDIEGLSIAGFRRSFSPSALWHNLKVPFMMMSATRRAKRILKKFAPDVVAGFGGYASAPIVRAAQKLKIPTVLQEQNSYAGLTNRLLGKGAQRICVASEGMERFFPAQKIVITGNPLRGAISELPPKGEARAHFSLDEGTPTILITGGSLGTRTLNEMIFEFLKNSTSDNKIQVIWQTGKFYLAEFQARMKGIESSVPYVMLPFIENMVMAYGAADVVVCRSGASTVSELQLVGMPALFVPSPNVAEDHQSANARVVVDGGGAEMVADSEAVQQGMTIALEILRDGEKLKAMSASQKRMAKPGARGEVADIIMSLTVK